MTNTISKKAFAIASGAVLLSVLSAAFAFAESVGVGTASSSSPSPVSAAPAAVCPAFGRSLHVGVTGSDVTALQTYLNEKGYLKVSATGYFGPLTRAAVAQWQADGDVVGIGGSGSGIFGPLSRAYFQRSCVGGAGGNSGGTSTNSSTTFSASPVSGSAPLTVQFTDITLQGGTAGSIVNFGDGTQGTLTMDPTFSAYSSIGTVTHTYTAPGTYTATLTNNPCACPLNGDCGPCNKMAILLGTATITVTDGGTATGTSTIQQMNAPASVTLAPGGIAEIRNESYYFTLTGLTSTTATIDVTPVGCWNSFPSDTPPQVRCMIAVVPIPPQTLSVGQTYTSGDHSVTLTGITSAAATFTVK